MKNLMVLVLLAVLTACGGGGGDTSSETPPETPNTSGSSGSTTASTVQNGTYQGKQNITLSLNGVSESTGDLPLIITVSNGRVSLLGGSGSLSGNKFSVTVSFSDTTNGITCSFKPKYSGSFANNKASGSISGPASCDGVALTMKGSFSTSSFAKGKLPSAPSTSKLVEVASKLVQ